MWHFGILLTWVNTCSTSGVTTDVARTPGGGIVALYLIGSSDHGGGVICNGSVGIGAGGVTNSEDAGAACGGACGASAAGCTSQPCILYFKHFQYLSHSKDRTGFL
jgi:hypothetical protein